jgi:flagellar protein FliL
VTPRPAAGRRRRQAVRCAAVRLSNPAAALSAACAAAPRPRRLSSECNSPNGTILALLWQQPAHAIGLRGGSGTKPQGDVMSNKLVIILIGVLFVLVLGMGGGMFMLWTKLGALSAQTASPENDKNAEKAKAEQMGKVVSLDTFIVNLADPGANRYLRVTMDLEVTGGKTPEEEVTRRTSQLRDAILMILPTKKFSEIISTEGKLALRDELLSALNALLASSKVSRIYFKEFVIQ